MKLKEYPKKINLSLSQKKYIDYFHKDKNINLEKINCPLCSESKFNILFVTDRHKIKQQTVMCNNCGLIYSNPRMDKESTEYFYNTDIYRKIYDGDNFVEDQIKELSNFTYVEPKEPNFSKYNENLYFDFICSQKLDIKSVCEIGCGNGIKLMNFKHQNKKIFGIEPSENYNKAHIKYGLNVKQGFIDDLKESYDIIILSHVLEHFHNPGDAIKKISDLNTKYLFIEVPGIIKKIPSIQNAHNFYFSKNTLNYFVLSNGFDLININYDKDYEFIFAIYKNSKNKKKYSYDFVQEKKSMKKIYYKYIFRALIINLLKFLQIGKISRKIWNIIRIKLKIKFF